MESPAVSLRAFCGPGMLRALLSVCLPMAPAHAATFGKLTFVDLGPAVAITGYPADATGDVVVPSQISGKPVIAISESAFLNCARITSVAISGSVTNIGAGAFNGCSGLTKVTLSEGTTTIGHDAFTGCSGLKNVTIPGSVTFVGSFAFHNCSRLVTARFPGNAPTGTSVGMFDGTAPSFRVCFISGASGFTTPTWKGYPSEALLAAVRDIAVEQPVGSELSDGGTRSFGSCRVGSAGLTKTFTIRNRGLTNLTGLKLSMNITNAGDFILGPLGKTTLYPGGKTTFKVTFKPTVAGPRKTFVRVSGNDPDENPFDIVLTSTGT
jgi:hypothetical protein